MVPLARTVTRSLEEVKVMKIAFRRLSTLVFTISPAAVIILEVAGGKWP
jgi:hypothetical protein